MFASIRHVLSGQRYSVRPDGNIDQLCAVEGIDVFFIGPGDFSQNMGYPPAPPFGQPRPQAVIDKVGFAAEKIRAAGKVAGTLVTSDELPYWREKSVHSFMSIPILSCASE
jgi:2-keto-3-deoxy-L-rhamnonate aldolase RhmA